MELIPAPGSLEMQRALKSACVQNIVDGLLHVRGKPIFRLIARFLREFSRNTDPLFANKLAMLKVNQSGRPNRPRDEAYALLLDKMVSDIEALYTQEQLKVEYQRGAIVELLVSKLVEKRCQANECYSNYRFIDGRYASEQVDVAVFSPQRSQCEAYTCKMNPNALLSSDCTNLTALAEKLNGYAYNTHIGAICFENSILIEQKIKWKMGDLAIGELPKAYGIDNLLDLEKDPFAA